MAWYDNMTPAQAKAYLSRPVVTKVVDRDHTTGRDIVAPVHMPSMNDLAAISKIAGAE